MGSSTLPKALLRSIEIAFQGIACISIMMKGDLLWSRIGLFLSSYSSVLLQIFQINILIALGVMIVHNDKLDIFTGDDLDIQYWYGILLIFGQGERPVPLNLRGNNKISVLWHNAPDSFLLRLQGSEDWNIQPIDLETCKIHSRD